MALTYHLIVPMPAGKLTATTGKLSVFFVPRLGDDGELTDYTTDWRNWPKVIRGQAPASSTRLGLRVALNGAVSPANDAIDVLSPSWRSDPPSVEAWDAIFGTAPGGKPVSVEGFRPVYRPDPLLAPMFDGPELASGLREIYQRLATLSPDGPPTAQQFADNPRVQDVLAAGELYDDHLDPLGAGDVAGEPTPEEADFHQAISFLQAHPELLRTLGLVVDLEVQLPGIGPVSYGGGTVSVQSNYDANYAPNRSLRLEVLANSDFWPVDGPGGWATVGDSTHLVESVDLGAGVSGIQDAATATDPTGAAAVPPMESAGLYLVRTGDDLFAELSAAWEAQIDLENRIFTHFQSGNPPQPLKADGETLTVGRRYDVWDTSVNGGAGGWFSLWQRTVPGGYWFQRDPALSITPPDDEGWMTYSASTEAPQVRVGADPVNQELPLPPLIDTTPLRVSPIVFSWRGWSLAARPPGRAFSGTLGPTDIEPYDPGASLIQVNVPYEVPSAVLPRLRYTRTYKFRARTVDYAGNSRELAEANPGGITETPEITFGRTSQLGAPTVIRREPRAVPGWGDTPTTLVVKSEFEQSDASVLPTSRLFFPPSTHQYQCELHGQPDPDGLFTDQATFEMLVKRTARSVADHAVVDTESGELVSDGAVWRTDVDYLVEVPTAGTVFTDLPGSTDQAVIPSAKSWPEGEAVGIELRAGDLAPEFGSSPSGPALTAWIPKGVTRDVFVSTLVDEAYIEHWSLFQGMDASEQASLREQIRTGRHWMFSQAGALKFVHAVRRPLAIPEFDGVPAVERFGGNVEARMSGRFRFDVKSTGRMRVIATWQDAVDTVGAPGGITEPVVSRLLFTQGIAYGETFGRPITDDFFQLPDTRRYDAVLSLDAISRYARYFTERSTVQFTAPSETVALADDLGPEGIAATNIEVTVGSRRAVEGRDFTLDPVAGTISQLPAGGLPTGTDIDVDFIRLPINRRSDEAGAPGVPVRFLNAGVPDVVSIEEVLPAFSRSSGSEGSDDLGVSHSGQVVRVWLRRPWFTTGVGELLGVLVGGPGEVPVTEVARDPLSPTPAPNSTSLGQFDFVGTADWVENVEGLDVDLAAYEVQFDETRELWFADVFIGADLGYRPIVKLSLVRYQPGSVDGASVSAPVITEPIRLGPNRSTQLFRSGENLEIDVFGRELGNEVIVRFQQRDPDIADADLGWTDLGDPITLTPINEQFVPETRWNTTAAIPSASTAVRLVVEDAELLQRQRPSGVESVRATAYIETIDLPTDWIPVGGTPPAAPTGVTATPQHQAVNVAWTAPDDGGNPILRYSIERRVGSGSWGDQVTVTAPATSAVVDGLDNGTQYGFRVRAENAAGAGPWSAEVTATPTPTVPAPVGPLETVSGHQAALVRWPAPTDTGSPVTAFRVERREGIGAWGSAVDLVAGSTRYIARGLSNGTAYEFRVRASNALGDGPWSEPAEVTPDVMVPGRVRRVVALSGGGLVRVRWREAAARGASVTGYQVQRRSTSGGDWGDDVAVGAAETDLAVNGLAAGSQWEFRVRAQNAVGVGAWSSSVTVTVEAGGSVPAQVQGVAVAPADRSLTVTWDEPADGGSALLWYTVQRRLNAGSWGNAVDVAADQLVHVYSGLTNGASYGVRVRAVNVVGAGEWSSVVTGSPTP